jgi:hypothetical protein
MIQVPLISLGNVWEQATVFKMSPAAMAHASSEAIERGWGGGGHTAAAAGACADILVLAELKKKIYI